MNITSIYPLITLIAISTILVTFTACGGNRVADPSPPTVQNISREIIIMTTPADGQTVLSGRTSHPAIQVVSPCR